MAIIDNLQLFHKKHILYTVIHRLHLDYTKKHILYPF